MKFALYIGTHSKDDLFTRIGWWLTRLAQKGKYGIVTHTEAIHDEYSDGSFTIVSSSLRDKGVRSKRVFLDVKSWVIVDVPQWDVNDSRALYNATVGQPYNWRGALALFLPGSPINGTWYCNQWCGHPYLKASEYFSPSQFAAIVLSLGVVDPIYNSVNF